MRDRDRVPDDVDAAWLAGAEVAIVGLGLMGGSLAGALRGAGEGPRQCRRVVGIVRDESASAAAVGWVDVTSTELSAVATADAVVLAAPPHTILALLPQVAARMRPGTLLLDLASTKGAIVAAMAALREDLLVVGGHPMCGSEAAGLAAADARLYQGASFVLCPVPGRSPDAVVKAAALAWAVGARPAVLDAAVHDRVVAAISHVPYAAAVALVLAAEQLAADNDGDTVWLLAAGGFRDTTRVAASELEMWIDILLTNRAEVLAHLGRLAATLDALAKTIDDVDVAALRTLLEGARHRRRSL